MGPTTRKTTAKPNKTERVLYLAVKGKNRVYEMLREDSTPKTEVKKNWNASCDAKARVYLSHRDFAVIAFTHNQHVLTD